LGHVRKDILNGWKEIGGYVCRDIRTVERWEKQRGLPVRRVPGAGRATVYALTSELDEWLENSQSEGTQNSGESLTILPTDDGVQRSQQPELVEVATGASFNAHSTRSQGWQPSPVQPFFPVPSSVGTPSYARAGRQRWVAAATVAVAAGAICLLASPVIRGHAKSPVESGQRATIVHDGVQPPYRSHIPGVDDLYLRGLYSYEQRTPESLQRSLEDFNAATAKDPSYAPAYAGLANTYNLMREYSMMPDAVAYPKAKDAAEHAIALDPRLPEAHASLGFIDFFWSWDPARAEHEFQTALALDGDSVLAHHWYGSMLMHEGRLDEAMEQLDIAQRLDPTSAAILSTRALAMGLDGHRGEAVDMLQDVVNVSPGVSSPHAILATLSNIEPRDPARYLSETKRSAEMRHNMEALQVADDAEIAYRSGGEKRMWEVILAAEERLHPGTEDRTYQMAEAEAALGRNDDAISDLTRLAAQHNPAMIGIKIDPTLLSLQQDPRFVQIIASIGLPHTTN
jgi:tetratricopeptide (TPR) repeat protein